ncbi:MAG: response regulator [Verrucomicrobia bacterium]|nr:response regulator [Verrucomicrobiota bacterium]
MDIRILLVDDEDGFRRPMEFWLKAKGYQVTGVNSGAAALDEIERERPMIVYLDMKMPGMNGIETLAKIREKDKTLPVIMSTAYGTPKDMKAAEALGVSGFFQKDEDFVSTAKLIVIALETSNILPINRGRSHP